MDIARGSRALAVPWCGLVVTVALLGLAMAMPAVTGWDVHIKWFPPLHASWDPRIGPGTLPALLVAWGAVNFAARLAEDLPWRYLMVACWAATSVWALSLAFVDGADGIGHILQNDYEYLQTARVTDDLPKTLQVFVSKIPLDAPSGNWPTHVAGHPPGALAFFILLDRIGFGGGFAAGVVVTLIGATAALGVLETMRVLGAGGLARRVAPLLTFGPAAIWVAVSADAVFAATAAWGIAALAHAATAERRRAALFAVVAGLLLGYLVMFSYGLPLMGVMALAVVIVARRWWPLLPAAAAAGAVVGVFALYGFAWWDAISVLRDRYWDGIARLRPAGYWIWANFAALAASAGPLVGAGLATWADQILRRRSHPVVRETRVVVWLVGSAVTMVVIADLSLMSKAEVERIWLPFVPWLLVSCALLPAVWRRRGLVLQLAAALLLQHLLHPSW